MLLFPAPGRLNEKPAIVIAKVQRELATGMRRSRLWEGVTASLNVKCVSIISSYSPASGQFSDAPATW